MDMLAAGPPSFAGLGGGDASPCQRTDVREWNHLDPLTGDRLRARLQADRWIVGQGGRYDKVVDSRNITAADGRLHSQHKQLEMLHARTAQGSVQVVRTRTVSSARWSSDHVPTPQPAHSSSRSPSQIDTKYEDITLPIHPLDLTTQRERIGIGRSGSIAARRPPTRKVHVQKADHDLSRSNSIENMSTTIHWQNDESEFQRVAKIRRSLQLRGRLTNEGTKSNKAIDIPISSGCVFKIKQELENSMTRQQNASKRYSSQEVVKSLTKSGCDYTALPQIDDQDDGIVVRNDNISGQVKPYGLPNSSTLANGTGSLESRRTKDIEDWHVRRKSYGFEGAIPVIKTLHSEESTDSGICRSVDISKNESQVDVVGDDQKLSDPTINNASVEHLADDNTCINIEEDITSMIKKNKKVEFSKTEIHFVADSGRVNIIDTDNKPPPTQNFRRRRRITINSTVTEPKVQMPVFHFGDDQITEKIDDLGKGGTEEVSTNVGESPWGVKLRHVSAIYEPVLNTQASQVCPASVVEECKFASVAERVRAVEQRRSDRFSTKINFGSGEPVIETRDSLKGRIWEAKSSEPTMPKLKLQTYDTNMEEMLPSNENKESINKTTDLETTKTKCLSSVNANSIERNNSMCLKASQAKSQRSKSPRKSPRPSPTRPSPTRPNSLRPNSPRQAKSTIRREKSPSKDCKSPCKTSVVSNSTTLKLKPSSAYRNISEKELAYFGVNVNKSESKSPVHKSYARKPSSARNESVTLPDTAQPKFSKQTLNLRASEDLKLKSPSPIYENRNDLVRLTDNDNIEFNQSAELDKSPAITETPKGRGRERIAAEYKGQSSRGRKDNKETLGNTPAKKCSTATARNGRRMRELCSLAPENKEPNMTNQEGKNLRQPRRNIKKASSRETLIDHEESTDDEDVQRIMRQKKTLRSSDRSKPKIPEYEYTLVTSKITKVCDKPATKTSKKKSSQPGMEQNDYGYDLS